MSSRIEQIIEEIEEYVESCKYQPLSTTKIIVNKEEIEELLRELRLKTPDEIKRYQKIISNKEMCIRDRSTTAQLYCDRRISVLYVMYITTGGIWEGEKRISKLSVFIETSEVRRPALICVHDFRWGRFRKIEILF